MVKLGGYDKLRARSREGRWRWRSGDEAGRGCPGVGLVGPGVGP